MPKQKRYIRKKATFTFPEGAAGAGLIQSEVLALEGELLWIHQRNSDNLGNRTAQLLLEDEDGYQFFDGGAKADNGSYHHEFGVTLRRILVNKTTLTCVLSGDPGAGGAEVVAVLYLVGRDG